MLARHMRLSAWYELVLGCVVTKLKTVEVILVPTSVFTKSFT